MPCDREYDHHCKAADDRYFHPAGMPLDRDHRRRERHSFALDLVIFSAVAIAAMLMASLVFSAEPQDVKNTDVASCFKMSPLFPCDDPRNCAVMDVEFGCQSHAIAAVISQSDLSHICFSKHMPSDIFAASLPPFVNHVSRVSFLRTQKKMIWANTDLIVASVKNVEAVGDWAISKFPCKTMSGYVSRIVRQARQTELTVPASILTICRPQPTAICPLYFRPKSYGDDFWSASVLCTASP